MRVPPAEVAAEEYADRLTIKEATGKLEPETTIENGKICVTIPYSDEMKTGTYTIQGEMDGTAMAGDAKLTLSDSSYSIEADQASQS